MITEKDAMNPVILSKLIHEDARQCISEEEYEAHRNHIFGREVLDYAKSLVINLPGPCYSNCAYCIDKGLRSNVTDYDTFLKACKRVLTEKSDFSEISITGGSLPAAEFHELMKLIRKHCPNATITWNTNGVNIDERYDINGIRYINLHRNDADDKKNQELFQTAMPILSIPEAKELFAEKLCIRVTVDENFDLSSYTKYKVPLYLNRLLPGTKESNRRFEEIRDRLSVSEATDVRRRNQYVNGYIDSIPVRLCIGDHQAERIQDRYPTWLNVVIIHREGTICGSWYLDDKFLF